jgi:hypothetical protein
MQAFVLPSSPPNRNTPVLISASWTFSGFRKSLARPGRWPLPPPGDSYGLPVRGGDGCRSADEQVHKPIDAQRLPLF